MLRAVDLDQFAPTIPAVARLIWARTASLTILPNPGLDHQLAECLASDLNAVAFNQVLSRQSRPKVMVMLKNKSNDMLAAGIAVPSVTRSAALVRNQTFGALLN